MELLLRSEFNSLQQEQIGTPYAESLVSYASRLAESHNVNLSILKIQGDGSFVSLAEKLGWICKVTPHLHHANPEFYK